MNDSQNLNIYTDETTSYLTRGLLGSMVPGINSCNQSLDDIMKCQKVMLETLQQENQKYTDCKKLKEVIATMDRLSIYYLKLNHIKKNMESLTERSTKLKKRALSLEKKKLSNELKSEQEKGAAIEEQKRLTAKMAKSS